VAAVKANAEHRAANLRTIVDDLRSQGFTSVRALATQLNVADITRSCCDAATDRDLFGHVLSDFCKRCRGLYGSGT
jgi:hypothetical protein